ncbi:MAG: universal stress protein [Gaiellaceae bacterium]
MPRPLLCCVDDSETARAAARYARDLSRRLSLELVLVHVAGTADAPGTSAAPGGHARLADAQREEGEEALARAARDAGVGEARRRLEFGSVVGRLLAVAVDEDAEMIVLGSRGRGRMRAAALGSVAAETATKAPCPVLVVSPAAAERAGLAS